MATKHPATTIRLTDEDRQMITELKQQLGIRSTTELIRLALHMLRGTSAGNIEGQIEGQSSSVQNKRKPFKAS
jgi:hypothetical protein